MILSKEFTVDPRVYKEAKSLIEAGHQVTVLMWDRKGGYEKESVIDEIKVIRLHNTSFMKILPNDLFRNPFWWKAAYKKALELYKNDFQFDVVHCHDLDTLIIGVLLKKKLCVKLVYDAHEIFGAMISNDVPKIIVKISFFIEKLCVSFVDYIITVNEPLENYFQKITKKPIVIVMNCTNLLINEYIPPNTSIFTISYMGTLNMARMFPDIVDIIGNIEGVKFIIAGKKENIYEEVKERCKKYKNVEFLGTISLKEAMEYTIKSNAVLCLFDPNDSIYKIGLPNKIFESMAAGRPVLVTKEMYYSKIIEEENCGVLVEYEENDIINGIITLRDNPRLCEMLGRNGLNAARTKYNWDKQKVKLLKVYEAMK
jgi:glycosyltransferase involved in cell wall biosynthesis